MKEYKKVNGSLSKINTSMKYYTSVSNMNSDITNIGENEIVSTLVSNAPTLFIKRNNAMVDLSPDNESECIGDIIAYYGSTNPDPLHYLVCDGSTYDTNAFPLLYDFTASNVLPNLMGYGLKGWGQNSGITSHDEISIGSKVANSLPIHSHTYSNPGHTHTATNCTHNHCFSVTFLAQGTLTCNKSSGVQFLCNKKSCYDTSSASLVATIGAASPAISVTGTTNNGSNAIRTGTEVKQKTKTVLFLIRGA